MYVYCTVHVYKPYTSINTCMPKYKYVLHIHFIYCYASTLDMDVKHMYYIYTHII